jgi:hypothetical protein
VEKPVHFSRHALQQMIERGATDDEVLEAIRSGEQVSAKRGRLGYRKNFQYERLLVRKLSSLAFRGDIG